MDAAFLTPREAIAAAGVPKTTAHRIKNDLSAAVQGRLLVVDGTPVTSPDAIIELLCDLAARAADAEEGLAAALERAGRLDEDLQLTRHELDVQRARAEGMAPRLAAIAAQVTQLVTENLAAPESRLTN